MPNKLLTILHKGQNFFLRQYPNYYLNELRLNAIKRKKKGYDNSRKDEIKYLHNIRRKVNKGLLSKRWTEKEIEFLRKNYKDEYQNIAKQLGRSTGSIEHKVLRLGLKKNNKWISKLK
jgi:hypothetical protein